MQGSTTSSLLLNSTSLKDLLSGVSDVRKRKIAIAKSEEMVGAILRKDAHDEEVAKKRQRARNAKKKASKKRSLMDRTSTGGGLQRARQMRYASNNVFEYALDLGLDRDSVEHLERQYRSSRNTVKDCVEKVQLGFEQLNGPDAAVVAPPDADILLTLLGAELEKDAFLVDGTRFPCNTSQLTVGHESSMEFVGDQPAELVDQQYNTVPIPAVPIDHFTRGLENFLQQRVMLLTLGEINGFTAKNAVDRFLNRDNSQYQQQQRTMSQDGLENSLFGTSQLEVGGQMDDSLYDTAAPDALSHTAHLNDTSDLRAMFVSSATMHRPNSQPEDFHHHTSTMGSTAPRMRLENDANFYSQSEKDILPPLRLGRMLRKQRKDQGLSLNKKQFSKAGFDASFTRATPRVLQNKATVGKNFAQGGGATEAEIEALRWELTVAREGIKHLDKMVDTNIAWVQSNCDMSGLAVNFSDRTKQKCRNMATERIVAVYVNLVENTQYWAIRRWQTAVRFDRLSMTVKKYSKLKGIEILTNTMWKVITNQMYNRGWKPWLRFVQAQILAKMNKAAIQIQRVARGRQGRVRFQKIKLGQVAITLQKLFRKTKAVQVIKEKRFVREQEMNNVAVRAIQKLLKKLINIRRAKAEANQRRMDRASIRIQKIHRGRQGRKEFLQNYLKKNHAERDDLDLERLAAAAPTTPKATSQDAADTSVKAVEEPVVTPEADTTHDPRKRSLFHKQHAAPTSQVSASASPSTTSSAAATPRSKQQKATASKGQVDRKRRSLDESPSSGRRPITPSAADAAAVGSTRKAPSNLSQPKHRHESPNPVRAGGKGEEKSQRSVRGNVIKVSDKHSARIPAPTSDAKPSVPPISVVIPTSRDSSPVPSRPPSGRQSRDSSGKKPSSRPSSRADSPIVSAVNASLLEYALEDEESLAGEAISLDGTASASGTQNARAQAKVTRTSASSDGDNSTASIALIAPRTRIRGGNSAENESTPPSTVRGSGGAGARGGKTSSRVAATSTKTSVRNKGSTRVAANVTPAAAAANIQKVARGKLARALSKKLLEEKETGPDGSGTPVSASAQAIAVEVTTPEPPLISSAVENASPLQLDVDINADETAAERVETEDHDGTASAAQDQTHGVYTDLGISASPSRDFSTTTGSRPNSSRQSILSLIPSSIMSNFHIPKFGSSSISPKDRPRSGSNFHFPGFSHKSDNDSVGSANSAAPSPVNSDRPRSSTFFRNPFSGWGSRESTPSRQRPVGEGNDGNSISFSHPNVIREEVEEDAAKQEANVKKIQSHVRGMLGRQRFTSIKEEREAAALAAAATEAAELAAATEADIETEMRPIETQAVKLKDKSATSSGIASARMVDPKNAPIKPGSATGVTRATGALARRGSANKTDALTPTGRRASFDKEKEEKSVPTRRRSMDKGNTQEHSISPKGRRASFNRDSSADAQDRVKRRSFDKESEGGLFPSATKGSMDEKDKSVPRRSSFDRSGEKSATRRASFDKSKDNSVGAALASVNKPSHLALSRTGTSAGGATGSATGTARSKSSTPEHHRRGSAPVGMSHAATVAAQAVASVDEDDRAPTPVPTDPEPPVESSQVDESEKDDYVSILPERLPPTAEFPDVPSDSATDNHSLPADDLSEADYSENSKMRGAPNSSEKKAPVSGSSKKHKDDVARASKEKAAQKKKDAEDKRKADAAKAKAAREERSTHKAGSGAGGATAAAAHSKPSADAKTTKIAHSAGAHAATPHKKPETHSSGSSEKKKALAPLEIDSEPAANPAPVSFKKTTTAPVMPSLEEVNSGTYSHSDSPLGNVTPKSAVTTPKLVMKAATPKFRTKANLDPTRAAAIIQNRARVKLSQGRIQKQKEQMISAQKKLGMLIHWAVITIQRNFRGRSGRKQFVQHAVAKQVALAQQQEIGARKMQAVARGRLGRKRFNLLQEKQRKERQEQAWVESYYKGSRKAPVPKGDGLPTKATRSSKSARLSHKAEPPSTDLVPNAAAAAFTAQQTEEMDAKIRELKEIQRSIQEQQEKMAEYARLTEANAAKMQQAVLDMEEKAKQQEAERLLQQQLFAMAAGPLSHRSDYASPMSTQQRRGGTTARQIVPNSARVPDAPPTARSARGGAAIPPDAPQMYYNNDLWVQLWDPDENAYYWYCERTQISQWDAPGTMRSHMGTGNTGHNATMPLASSRRSVPNSARVPNAPPTARSARSAQGSTSIPPDAPQMTYNGEIWVQLWDSEESAYYWYCERTGFAQWEAPGSVGNQSTTTMVANYYSDGADSGYESAGAMTDYSTDHYEDHSAYTSDSEYENSVWQEFWDESAQAKYWYNNNTGEASWTRPETAASSHGSEEVPLAITNGLDTDAAAGANEWVSYIDEDTEQAYWYNVRTGETSWA